MRESSTIKPAIELTMEPDQQQSRSNPIRSAVSAILTRIRRAFGVFLQLVQRDQLVELSSETRRLGAASVEASTYVGGELQAIETRLARLEEEIAAIRRALEEQGKSLELR